MKRQGLRVTISELKKLTSSLREQQRELQKKLGLKNYMKVNKNTKFLVGIINKTPKCCDTWEIEK